MLNSINDVKRFVAAASARPCDIDVVSGRYIIDAKSIMGIFSIDLSNQSVSKFMGHLRILPHSKPILSSLLSEGRRRVIC